MEERALRRTIGLADSCELMTAAFAFPDEALAAALADGSFRDDAVACLADAGADAAVLDEAAAVLAGFVGVDATELSGRLRKGHTILYLTPGHDVPVWPYEAAFRYTAERHEGAPALFRSARTIDVERHMREAGVLPKTARTEPADSVWNEFSFLAYLYGSSAAALQEGCSGDALVWHDRAANFWDEHAGCWLYGFMARTREEAPGKTFGEEYAALASLGLVVLETVRADVAYWKNRA